jgi:hypothetical protein
MATAAARIIPAIRIMFTHHPVTITATVVMEEEMVAEEEIK